MGTDIVGPELMQSAPSPAALTDDVDDDGLRRMGEEWMDWIGAAVEEQEM